MPPGIKTTRPFVVIAVAGLVVLGVRLAWPTVGVPLLINTTRSEPYGLYRLQLHRFYSRGTLVVFPVPAAFESLVTERGWLGKGVPLLKAIGAVSGDRVCVFDDVVTVNGMTIGPVFRQDSNGRPLPSIRGCEVVAEGHFWPLSGYTPNSFDGRYMGAQPLSAILGEAIPVWTF